MYVCVCNAINCKTVRKAAEGGARSIAGVFKHAGKQPQCGRCFPMMREMIGADCGSETDPTRSGLIAAAE